MTNHKQGDTETHDLEDCSTQRNLSQEGREQAPRIGSVFKQFEIPVGEVLSSPYCRTKDTGEIAFAQVHSVNDLRFAIKTDQGEGQRLGKALRKLLMTRPEIQHYYHISHSQFERSGQSLAKTGRVGLRLSPER